MNSYRSKLLTVFALATLILPFATSAYTNAQEQREGIGISPTRLTLDADPGEVITGKFSVINTGDLPVGFRVFADDFRIRNEEYEKDFEPIPGVTSPVDWIKITGEPKQLDAGKSQELEYTISVPEDTAPRGYYGVLFAETLPTGEADSSGVARLKRVGTLVYLTVNGDVEKSGKIESFKVSGWQREKPVKAELRINNEGSVHFPADGSVWIKDILGRELVREKFSGTIIPDTIRKYNIEMDLKQPFGIYKVGGDANFLDKTTPLEEKWILVGHPLWIGLGLLLIIAWIAVLIRWISRRGKYKKTH